MYPAPMTFFMTPGLVQQKLCGMTLRNNAWMSQPHVLVSSAACMPQQHEVLYVGSIPQQQHVRLPVYLTNM